MYLPKSQISLFIKHLGAVYGAVITVRLSEQTISSGEYARTVLNDRLVVIREMIPKTEAVEIFCSDKQFLKTLEETWSLSLEPEETKNV